MVKTLVKDLPDCKKELSIEVPPEDVSRCLEEVYQDIGKNAEIPGFRKGKAPRDLIIARYQASALRELLDRLIPDSYRQAVQQLQLRTVSLPEISQVNFDREKPLIFKAQVEVYPEVQVKAYAGLPVAEKKVEVKPEEVERVLADLRERNARFLQAENRGVKAEDFLLADVEIQVEEKTLEKKKNAWMPAGVETGVPGFRKNLLELKAGEEKEFTVTLPENFPRAEFAKKTASCRVKINEIREKQLPELNDAFVRQFSGCQTLDELKAMIGQDLRKHAEEERERDKEEQIYRQLLEKADFPVPESMVKSELDAMVNTAMIQLVYQGFRREQVEGQRGQLEEKFRDSSRQRVKLYFLLLKIAQKENIRVDDKEVDGRIARMAEERKQTVEQIRGGLEKDDLMDDLRDRMLREKVRDFLLGKAKITPA